MFAHPRLCHVNFILHCRSIFPISPFCSTSQGVHRKFWTSCEPQSLSHTHRSISSGTRHIICVCEFIYSHKNRA
ncbi:uncharacterized protein BJX67DRAFT_286723 [Aspergillus lucknowensis]|uniref:Secreted protein n=1 Tax=Aspergillus lucknowensis TaxID=176173 RepID=A0ABR4M1A5_9EURO